MRPIEKKIWKDELGNSIDKEYDPYTEAKDDLIANIGKYCSYCEVPIPPKSSVAIEHIKPKSLPKYGHLSTKWSNFLFSCTNCNAIKGTKDFEFDDLHLPHKNNTLLSFRLDEGGLLRISPNLSVDEKQKAEKTIWLVGIDRRPGDEAYSSKDDRWQNRFETWNLAVKYLKKYRTHSVSVDVIVDLALAKGFFTVWLTVFESFVEVRKALIHKFEGTATTCFDSSSNAINRNGLGI